MRDDRASPPGGLVLFPESGRFARAALSTRELDFRRAYGESTRKAGEALAVRAFVRAEQVHGARVALVEGPLDAPVEGADGLVTRERGLALLAFGADCPGVAILSDEVPAVAVAHSGWRGAVADVAPEAALALVREGAKPAELRAWIGPGIGPCCFEVGDEVVSAFESAHGPLGGLVSRPRGKKAHIDLKGAIRRRLVERAGLSPERIDSAPECTKCSPDRFFSRRGEGPSCGHHAILAWLA